MRVCSLPFGCGSGPLGTRGQVFFLNPGRPNALQPRKRPRATLTPTMVTRGGAPFLPFGTPGGDGQDQWTLQFYPRNAYPGRVEAESRLPAETLAELRRRGHDLKLNDGWNHGKPLAIHCHPDRA